jgi:diguanylate cyclase (GGDEF)-like protein
MENILYIIATAVIGALVFGLLIGRIFSSANLKGRARLLEEELQKSTDSLQRVIKDQSRQLSALHNENSDISRMIIIFPDMAEDITASISIDDLSTTIIKVSKQLLEAEEIAFFVVEKENLLLKTYSGFSKEATNSMVKIKIGEGRIGWAAEKKIIMTDEDFRNESILIKEQLHKGGHEGIKIDICAPLIYRGRLYGLIAIGKPSKDIKNIKKFLMMISHLSAATMENIHLISEIQHQADVDGLTKLYNITYFHKHLQIEIDKASRFNRNLTIFLFDIDNFKLYNDLNGHPAGDLVLSALGKFVKENLRLIDIPARYGGEEFIIMFPETGSELGMQITERMRKQIENINISFPQNKPWERITISGGIATYPLDGKDEKALIKAADVALYNSKKSGKNRIIPYEQSFTPLD